MDRKQQFILIGIVLIVVVLACQSNIAPVPSLEAGTTKPAETIPTLDSFHATLAVYQSEAAIRDNEFLAFQSNILADPNTICAQYLYIPTSALSCLNKKGWRVYFDIYPFIAQCPDGRIYLYRGDSFYVQDDKTFFKIVDHSFMDVFYLACGPGNEFWVSHDNGISHFDGLAWTDYQPTNYLYLLKEIAVAPNGNLWVMTDDGMQPPNSYGTIATFDGTDWQIFEEGKGFEQNPDPNSLVVDENGNVWVSSGLGLLKYDGARWTTFSGPEDTSIRFITLDHANRVWTVTSQNFYTFDPQTNSWVLQFGRGALKDREIEAMQFDRRGRLWVNTDYGLYIHDGSTWTAYHTFTSDLYANDALSIIVLGDGPQLPPLTPKSPGSVRGKLVNPNSTTSYANLKVEICLDSSRGRFFLTPCERQAYHALTTMDADGNFLFTDVPVGKYYLMIEVSPSSWSRMKDASSPSLGRGTEFEVYPGTETQLGEIMYSSESK
jgi:hypothetical protein